MLLLLRTAGEATKKPRPMPAGLFGKIASLDVLAHDSVHGPAKAGHWFTVHGERELDHRDENTSDHILNQGLRLVFLLIFRRGAFLLETFSDLAIRPVRSARVDDLMPTSHYRPPRLRREVQDLR